MPNVHEIIGKSEHKQNLSAEFSIHGVENTDESGRLPYRYAVGASHDLRVSG